MKETVLAVAMFLLAFGPAQAQNNARWQGAYVGVNGIASSGTYSVSPSLDTNGSAFGLYAGYNQAIGQSGIFGAELHYQIGSAGEGTARGYPWVENIATVRLRGGFALSDALVYAGVGASWADLELKGRTLAVNGPQVFFGVEIPFSERVAARVEYSTTSMPLPGPPVFDPGHDVTTRMLYVGLTFSF